MADEQEPRPQTAEEKYAPKLPKQLQEQVDAVNAAIAQQQPPEEPDEQDEQQDEQYEDDEQQDEQDDQRPQQEFQPQQEEDSWERRFRSAQGRLEQTLTANQLLTKRLGDLENEVNLMRVRGAEPAKPPVPKVKPQYVKKEEVDDYGEEFFDVVGRKAKEEFVPVIEDFSERLKRLESGQQAVGKVVEQGQKRGLYDTLHDEVPEWRDINKHPAFLNWLAMPDAYSGRQRHEMLKEAFTRHDADRVVNFFRGFLTEATGSPSNTPRPQGQSAPPSNGSGKPSLESFAAPGRARSAPQDLPPDKPVYSTAWIAKFMADKRTGKFRGREAEAEATERDIYQAQHEGRIQ